jgi:hypothetical protein
LQVLDGLGAAEEPNAVGLLHMQELCSPRWGGYGGLARIGLATVDRTTGGFTALRQPIASTAAANDNHAVAGLNLVLYNGPQSFGIELLRIAGG